MRLGIFTKHFERGSFEEVLDAVAAHGFATVQLNLESVVVPPDAAPLAGLRPDQWCGRAALCKSEPH
jgi:sugar phosphate isomerase/epimerase